MTRVEAIASRFEAIAIRWEAIATRVEIIPTSNKKLLPFNLTTGLEPKSTRSRYRTFESPAV